MKKILSGIQPTGNMHLGNYLGAIKNWLPLQKENDCLFCLVDLHALTTQPDPKNLKESIFSGAALYLAAGINPEKSSIFIQSQVPAHSELMWLLSCFTPMGWLNRMTQFKEKSGKHKDKAVLGLYSYPVLMAADILLYQATHVPVGEDQKQHIEMTRDLAISINQRFNKELFTIPEPLIQSSGARIMSLRDGTKKMSKSDPSDMSRIGIFDSPELILDKFKRAKTDSGDFPVSSDDLPSRPEINNLIQIYSSLASKSIEEILQDYQGKGFAEFKKDLAEICIEALTPIRTKYHQLINEPEYVWSILKKGQEEANNTADKTLHKIKDTLGLPN
ncbi:MAG: tryptophan--tRNA ligase [Rickettsiales bacterium]|nr:tryptophan--tRNA ligase [Rickettsiales bacterium]|tara:strand:- start:57229 stop:58224 length:996 start_codon:yes stop_codon:yes gene_type:complete